VGWANIRPAQPPSARRKIDDAAQFVHQLERFAIFRPAELIVAGVYQDGAILFRHVVLGDHAFEHERCGANARLPAEHDPLKYRPRRQPGVDGEPRVNGGVESEGPLLPLRQAQELKILLVIGLGAHADRRKSCRGGENVVVEVLKTQSPDLAQFAWQRGYGGFSVGRPI